MEHKHYGRIVEEWVQGQIIDEDAIEVSLRVGLIRAPNLGLIATQGYHPLTKVLYSSKCMINIPGHHLQVRADQALAELLELHRLTEDQVEPFEDRPDGPS